MTYKVVATVRCSNKADEKAVLAQLLTLGKEPPLQKKNTLSWEFQGQVAAEKMHARVLQGMKKPKGRPRPGEPRATMSFWSASIEMGE